MAEVTKAMIYEMAMAVQTRVGALEQGMDEICNEVRGLSGAIQALRSQVGSVKTGIASLREMSGAINSRVSPIERRLDLIDVPAT